MDIDVFISYAAEDEESIVEPLAAELRRRAIRVWYSGIQVRPGDDVAGSIDEALRDCKCFVPVLSPNFFGKKWPERETRATCNREVGLGRNIIVPLWCGVTLQDVQSHFPLIADKRALLLTNGLGRAANDIALVIRSKTNQPERGLVMNVSVAIIQRGQQVLVVRRRQKEGTLSWAFPAGRVKATEDAETAAVRETKEETGITCKVLRTFGERVHPNTGTALSYWLCEHTDGEAEVLDAEELAEVRWVSGEEAISLFTSDIYAPVKEYLLALK